MGNGTIRRALRGTSPMSVVGTLTLWGFVAAFVAIEIFNIQTTRESVRAVFGGDAVGWLIFALAITDLAGVVRAFGIESISNAEEMWLNLLWLVVAALNAVLTWWQMTIDYRGGDAAAKIAHIDTYAPLVIAVLVFVLRIGLAYGIVAVATHEGTAAKAPRARTKQYTRPKKSAGAFAPAPPKPANMSRAEWNKQRYETEF